MKKLFLLGLLIGVLIVVGTSSGLLEKDAIPPTLGILLEFPGCNDQYYVVNQLDTTIYELHGHEYGCGDSGILCTGTVKLAGGIAYFGWTATYNYWDYGTIGVFTAPISLATKSGTGMYMFIYSSSGITSHGSSSAYYSISLGSDPLTIPPGVDRGENMALRR